MKIQLIIASVVLAGFSACTSTPTPNQGAVISRVAVEGVEYPVYAYFKDVKAVSFANPVYPYRAKQERRGGETLVGAVVGEKGKVVTTFVAKSTGAGDIQQAACDAVKQWKFPKLKIDDKPIRYVLFVPVVMNP